MRLRIDSDPILKPTLDPWYTFWFSKLCLQVRDTFPAAQNPGLVVPIFQIPLDDHWQQQINLRYVPSSIPGSETPRRRHLECIMLTLIKHFFAFGARELRFNVLGKDDTHIAVGYITFGRVAPQLNLPEISSVNSSDLAILR